MNETETETRTKKEDKMNQEDRNRKLEIISEWQIELEQIEDSLDEQNCRHMDIDAALFRIADLVSFIRGMQAVITEGELQ